MRGITSREIAELEKRHKRNVDELAQHLSARTGIHHSEIRGKLHEMIDRISLEKRLAIKKHMAQIGSPALAIMILEGVTGGGVSLGTVSPETIWLTAVIGGVGGWLLSKRYQHKIKELEIEHAKTVKGRLGKVF
jgi:hypothetical protein